MKEILNRIWQEPAVAIGLLTSIILLIIKLVDSEPWDTSALLGIIAPFVSALGIRQVVDPHMPELPDKLKPTPKPESPL